MELVKVELGSDSYDIAIGAGVLDDASLLTQHISGGQVFIVSNETIATHYLETILAHLEGFKVDHHLVPDGESFKTLSTLEAIIGALISKGHNRATTILALGGGVVGDMAGFTAASYQRGVPFIQIPTTLLSQVDSSVGGKTAVNHALGKNMMGAFYQPQAVLIDTNTLSTLPGRELSAGLAEVIKHGVLADLEYLDVIESNMTRIRALDNDALNHAIRGSCEIKARIVAADEREQGVRAHLNFGHTFGHAIETGLGYGQWLHGEAVAVGMLMAADLSARMGRCRWDEAARLKQLVVDAGLPSVPPADMSPESFGELMARDKKATLEGIRYVLMAGGLGRVELVSNVPLELLQETLLAGEGLCTGK